MKSWRRCLMTRERSLQLWASVSCHLKHGLLFHVNSTGVELSASVVGGVPVAFLTVRCCEDFVVYVQDTSAAISSLKRYAWECLQV